MGLDSVGIARSELRLDFDITGVSPNSSIVTLNNFSGVLSAKKSTLFGAAFQTLLWKGLSTLDSLVSPSNLILDGSVRIENGQVIMAGMFAPGDFIISNAVDPQTGDSIIQVEPVPGLQKTFTVAGDTTDNSIAVTTSSSAGFGTFDPNQVYVNSRLPSTIPTLSEWGMMIFAGLLVTVGAFYISKG